LAAREKPRCDWARGGALDLEYHDREWGVPVRDDRPLFEFLTLEGAQAGLSWSTVLRKRENYRAAFCGFEVGKVARFDRRKIERLLADPGIIRNRLKVESAVNNARLVLKIIDEFGNFSDYLWSFVDGRPIRHAWRSMREVPAETPESQAMSKEMRRRGFNFVGPTIMYAFMQAVGMVNDHLVQCFRYREVGALGRRMKR
jgi:DNA-3-methyladenine glycosylase I